MSKLQRFTESLCVSNAFYEDITSTAPASMKENLERVNTNYRQQFAESKSNLTKNKVTQILQEANVDDSIVQKVVQRLSDLGIEPNKHRIYKIPISRINTPEQPNGNGRAYTLPLWQNVMNNQEHSWKGLCGLADHPSGNEPGLFRDSSVVWLGMEIDEPNKLVYGIGSFVGDYGHLAQEIIDVGGRVGTSSSGFGELESDGITVNPETFQIERLADIVLNPSQDIYGDINDEQKNIEYSRQTVKESISKYNTIKESSVMENTGVKSALSKVEEKELRKHIKTYLEENTKIANPVKQLQDLEEIQSLIREGQLKDLEDGVAQKLEEAHKKIEDAVEKAMSLNEANVTVTTPEGVSIEVKGEETVEAPVEDEVVEAPVETEDYSEEIYESNLTDSQKDALRKYVDGAMNESRENENPLKTYNTFTGLLKTVKESKLGEDLENTISEKLKELSEQLEKDIEDVRSMKEELGAKDISKITESTKNIMAAGELLAGQVTDYKALCESLTKRNTEILKEFNSLKTKMALSESLEEESVLTRNQKVVSLEKELESLQSKYDSLDERAGNKLAELEDSLAKYSEGNKKLEKHNGILETRLREAQKENKELKNEFKSQLDELDSQYTDELDKNKELVEENETLAKELEEVKVKVEELEKKIEELEAKAVEVKEEPVEEEPIEQEDIFEEKTLKESVSFKESGVENLWNDLHNRYGESVEPYERKIRGAKTVREAQKAWYSIMFEVDSNLKTVQETSSSTIGRLGNSERLAKLQESGMVTPEVQNRNNVSAVNARFLEQLRKAGLQ